MSDPLSSAGRGQNPQDAIESATGKYSDAVTKLSDADRILQTPKGTDPNPFRNMREATGSREG